MTSLNSTSPPDVLHVLLDSMPPTTLVSRLRSALDPAMGHTHEEIAAFLDALKGLGLERAVDQAERVALQNRGGIWDPKGPSDPRDTLSPDEAVTLPSGAGAGGDTCAGIRAPIRAGLAVGPLSGAPEELIFHGTKPSKPTQDTKQKGGKGRDKPIAKLPYPFPQTTPLFLFASPSTLDTPASSSIEHSEASAGLEAASRLRISGQIAMAVKSAPYTTPNERGVPAQRA